MATLQNPIISTSALTLLPEAAPDRPVDKMTMFDTLEKLVDIVIDDDRPLAYEVSTILDMEGDDARMIRQGLGWEAALDSGAQPV